VWTNEDGPAAPVEDSSPSTHAVPGEIVAAMPIHAVVPGIHTAYDFYERIYLNA
jgi:hypothetical protein